MPRDEQQAGFINDELTTRCYAQQNAGSFSDGRSVKSGMEWRKIDKVAIRVELRQFRQHDARKGI
jgi:hypothetical protein